MCRNVVVHLKDSTIVCETQKELLRLMKQGLVFMDGSTAFEESDLGEYAYADFCLCPVNVSATAEKNGYVCDDNFVDSDGESDPFDNHFIPKK